MWGKLFSQGIFPSKQKKNSNLQDRITSLFESKVHQKDCSPMLLELQRQKNKVKRLSSVYEGNIAAWNEANSSVVTNKSLSESITQPPPVFSPLTSPTYGLTIEKSIEFMIKLDADYIKLMESLIEKYVKEFEDLPSLRMKNESAITSKQKTELFGQIENIYALHRVKFHPMLIGCAPNVLWFARNISKMCQEKIFNVYLIQAMDERAAEYRRNVYYKHFIDEIIKKHGIIFNFAPVQQLARYHLILVDILRELYNNNAPEVQIKAVSKAEADWKSMMDKIYSMRNAPSLL